jgi:hypothetical protein
MTDAERIAELETIVATLTRERDALQAIDAENRDIACNLEEWQLWVVSGLRASMSLSAWCRWCGVVREAVKAGRVDHLDWCATKTGIYPRLDVIADMSKHMKELQDEVKHLRAAGRDGGG